MPELYRDWVPAEEKAPASQSGSYKDWEPGIDSPPAPSLPEPLRPLDVAAPLPEKALPVVTREGMTYHCRDCKEPFESLGLLMKHRKETHQS